MEVDPLEQNSAQENLSLIEWLHLVTYYIKTLKSD